MSEISDLEKRVTAALDRMRAAHQTTQSALNAANGRVAALDDEIAATPKIPPEEASRAEELTQNLETAEGALSAEREKAAELSTQLDDERAEVVALMNALAAEKDTVAALTEEGSAGQASVARLEEELRVHRAGERIGNLREGASSADLQGRVTELERTVQQLQMANAQLRQNNSALRSAIESEMPDADLVNDGLKAEIDALSAARAADRAEIDSVLAALNQLVEEKADA